MLPKSLYSFIWIQSDAFGLRFGRMNLRLVREVLGFMDVLPRSLVQKNLG
jgi:hypothetical protein